MLEANKDDGFLNVFDLLEYRNMPLYYNKSTLVVGKTCPIVSELIQSTKYKENVAKFKSFPMTQ